MSSPGLGEVRARLSGPVASVRTLFDSDGGIDTRGIQRYLDFALQAGSRAVILTFGDSLYSVLTDAEVAEVTRTVVDQVAGRALVVAADKPWWTRKSVEFARYARGVGADAVMVLPPDWGASSTADTLVAHYAAVAAESPVMIVTGVFLARGAAFGLEVIRRLHAEVPEIFAVKDDFCGEFARKLSPLVRDRWVVISGGQKQNHLDLFPYGCDGYLSTFITFGPSVAQAYWEAISGGDIRRAASVVREFDMPFFDFALSHRGGFDAVIHGCYELVGIASRWRRPPYHSMTDQEMERLTEFLRERGLV